MLLKILYINISYEQESEWLWRTVETVDLFQIHTEYKKWHMRAVALGNPKTDFTSAIFHIYCKTLVMNLSS